MRYLDIEIPDTEARRAAAARRRREDLDIARVGVLVYRY